MIDLSNEGVFKITELIFQGKWPDKSMVAVLRKLGVKNILNVSQGILCEDGFNIAHVPIEDLKEIPVETAVRAITPILNSVKNGERIYVHCVAGQNRSAVCVFLGLLALGYAEDDAEELIDNATLDAVPRHAKLVTDRLIEQIKKLAVKI